MSALTRAQRYFYDVNGYVVLPGVLSADECRALIALADRMDADDACAYKHDGYPKTPPLTVLSRCAWYDPALLDLALDERILPVIEEIVGGEVRLEEHQFLVNFAETAEAASRPVARQDWHRGIAPSYGSFVDSEGYHCLFSKAFLYLTDNGPGEGTWVVPGSHRLETSGRELREFIDETLARQLTARAGDILYLSETLIHAGPHLPPGASPRYSLVYGYSAPFMQTWQRYDPPAELLARVDDRQRRLLTGEARYHFRPGKW